MKLHTALLVFLSVWCSVSAKCVMRGECYTVNGFDKPCPAYNTEAPPLIDGLSDQEATEILSLFRNRCPDLFYDNEGNQIPERDVTACCTPDQVRKMSDSLILAEGVLGRCPTCLRNFAAQICEMNCSPDQSRFVDVVILNGTNDIQYVNEINYRVYEDFMLDAHASCSGVVVPQTGLPAINLMCGSAVVCDADAWFGFTGDTQANPLAPVQVNFLRVQTKEDSMHKRALPCNETFGSDLPCSCVDCLPACPIGTEPVVPDICTVISVNCIGFSVGIVFFVLSVTIFIFLAFMDRRYQYQQNSDSSKVNSGPNKLTQYFQKIFSKLGGFSADNPVLVIMVTTWVGFAMIFGAVRLNLTTNPTELWSAPKSRSRMDLDYFNTRFGPFYRTAQVFLTFDLDPLTVNNVTYGPAFNVEALQELLKLEDSIIAIGRDVGGVTLEEVCYAPLRSRGDPPNLDQCVSMSASIYLGNDRNIDRNYTYLATLQNCINNHFGLSCLAPWGGGAEPELTFGGYKGNNILSATTLMITFPIANFLLQEDLEPVLEWEGKFIDLLLDYRDNKKPDYVTVAFGTERSVEDEIARVSVAEAVPIAISYVIMFIYVTFALGNIRSVKTWFVDSKVSVAISSILIVLLAIFSAIGVMGYAEITLTLFSINVIPFFVLSVGIDNVFLMVNTLDDIKGNLKSFDDYKDMTFDKKRKFVFEKMLRRVGPSVFVSSVTQVTCFAIGTLANFPAVQTFAIFASLSLGFLFIFQVTTVVAILSLDYKRAAKNRLDLLWCIQKKILDDENPLHSESPHKGITQRLMEPYAKILLDWRSKIIVVIIFMAVLSISAMLIPQIEIGLDQQLALPPDSYVYQYLIAVNQLMNIGPPVYFVLKKGLNFSDPTHQNVICGGQMCNDDSLTTQIFLASQHSNITYIAKSSNSWLDDFIDWSSLYGACCKYNTTDLGFCPSLSTAQECSYCEIQKSEYANGNLRPDRVAFERYIPFFLQDAPSDICNKAGLASYAAAVNYVLDSNGRATVHDTNFMAFHSPLGTSKDYITAVKYGYEIAANITEAIRKHTASDVEVFPYSVFYVYYEQYLTMWGDTFSSIGFCLIGAMVFNLIASGFNVLTTFAIMVNAIMVVVNMMGVMYIWDIPLNAVSCVNLIVSIGISVEFCSHIAYAYTTSKKQGQEKVEDALQQVGATIITGITFTNIPIIVLAFSYTEVIEVFFFRMFFSLVILGFTHGMIFFPVLLSYLDRVFKK